MDTPLTGWPVHKEAGADMVGELIGGHHRIIRRLAKGGMADVFLAKDQARKAPVALKILRSRSPEARRRFVVEGVVLSNLKHPSIVRAVAVGDTPDGQPFMALEYLEGETLSARLARGPMSWRDVATFGSQIAGAVHALHMAGIVHRDLKPDNIMLTTEDGRELAKLIDLGVARVGAPFQDAQDARFTPDPPARHQTQLGHPIGTPAYLPPEAGYCPAEPRLDVFALGVTLYQLCTQLLPQATNARPIREVCTGSDAPDELSRLLKAALEQDVDERLPSADHLRRGLEAILAAHPPGSRHLFGGSYDRLEVLGVGASAVVFRASDRWLSREVAVKVLREAQPSEDDAIRFRRAAKVLSALRHSNIPRILHFGTHEQQSFAVTELCSGSPATSFVRPDNHLRPDEVIAVGQQLAGALAAVHAAGVIYRDLHPGNVLIARGEATRAWIFDFDQAQLSPEFYSGLTERWATPPEERAQPKHEKPLQNMDYASPEVRAGAAFSAASDVFALGLLLYRLLTGKRPFPVAGGEPTPARKLCPACPVGLEGLLLRMLSPVTDHRPALCVVQTDLENELDRDLAEIEDRDAPYFVAAPPPAAEPLALEPPIPLAEGPEVHAAATASGARHDVASSVAERAPGRAATLFALVLTAVVGLMVGRATVPSSPPPRTDAAAIVAPGDGPEIDPPTFDARASAPAFVTAPVEAAASPVGEAASQGVAEVRADPPRVSVATAELRKTPRRSSGPSPAPQREAVTSDEAEHVAKRELDALRACANIPGTIIAELDIAHGRGSVVRLNRHAPSGAVSWHGCARDVLESLAYPVSEAAGRVRVRLTLE